MSTVDYRSSEEVLFVLKEAMATGTESLEMEDLTGSDDDDADQDQDQDLAMDEKTQGAEAPTEDSSGDREVSSEHPQSPPAEINSEHPQSPLAEISSEQPQPPLEVSSERPQSPLAEVSSEPPQPPPPKNLPPSQTEFCKSVLMLKGKEFRSALKRIHNLS